MRRYALTILSCALVAVCLAVAGSVLDMPVWAYPLAFVVAISALSSLKLGSVGRMAPVQALCQAATWERSHPVGAGVVVGAVVGVVSSGILFLKAPEGVSTFYLYLISLGFGMGLGVFIGVMMITELRPRRHVG